MPTTKCWRLEHVLLTHSFHNYYSVAFAFVSPFICMLRGEFLMYTVLLIFRTEILHSDKFSYVLETAQPLQIINRFHENFYKKYQYMLVWKIVFARTFQCNKVKIDEENRINRS
jgi:hypothetical protein